MRTASQTFAANLARLMATRVDLDTQEKVAKKAGISQSTVARVLKANTSTTLNHADAIARAFGSSLGSMLQDMQSELVYDRNRFARMPEKRRALVRATVEQMICEYEANL